MGGKSSPTIWGRYAAAIGRILASISDLDEFRCEIYIDDPLMAVSGTPHRRAKVFTMALLALSVLGCPLAWEEGFRGSTVVWIGAELSASPEGI